MHYRTNGNSSSHEHKNLLLSKAVRMMKPNVTDCFPLE